MGNRPVMNRPLEEHAESGNPASTEASPVSLGRRLGMIVYWIILLYVISAGALSIIPRAFGFVEDRPDTGFENRERTTEE